MNARWEYIAELVSIGGEKTGVELGVKEGRFTYYLLKNIPWVHMTSVDLWDNTISNAHEDYKQYPLEHFYLMFKAGIEKDFPDRCEILRMDTVEAADLVDDVDFVFIDADHSYEGVKRDILAWKNKCKSFISGHDYNLDSVKQAVHEILGEPKQGPNNVWMVPC